MMSCPEECPDGNAVTAWYGVIYTPNFEQKDKIVTQLQKYVLNHALFST